MPLTGGIGVSTGDPGGGNSGGDFGPTTVGRQHVSIKIDLSVGLTFDKSEMVISLTRVVGDQYLMPSTTVRVYYVPEGSILVSTMNGPNWFGVAQLVKKFVVELSFSDVNSIDTTIPAAPYITGGWFYATQILQYSGVEAYGSDAVLVPVNLPGIGIPDILSRQVQNVSVGMVNVGGNVIKMTFKWQLPNVTATPSTPLGPLLNGHIQIWLYNYRSTGDWRKFNVFDVNAKPLQYETGETYYVSDYDGIHNVEAHFVACNHDMEYKEPFFTTIPAPFVTLVGGVGP